MALLLRAFHVTGWRRHMKLLGNPDFVWREERVALFVDGCFWHGHNCGRNLAPKTNAELWEKKIITTRERDATLRQSLSRRGWAVITVWECELKKFPDTCINRIRTAIRRRLR